ncbi:SDR family oxidoreductase [Nitrospira sp. M1]
MYPELKSKVVLVTGGSSGIGRAAALAFSKAGAKVIVAARRVEEGNETASMIREAGGEANFVKTNVSKVSDVEALVSKCLALYGELNYAFNNAGTEGTPFIATIDYDEQVWDRVMAVNLKGLFLCMKYEIAAMCKQGNGSIVNMSSIAGLKGGRTGVAYHASKHGIIGLTKASAVEYAEQGIRINAVCPAIISTPMTTRVVSHDKSLSGKMAELCPIGRVGTPEEVAAAVLWLCSDQSSFITGHALPIDGGRLA